MSKKYAGGLYPMQPPPPTHTIKCTGKKQEKMVKLIWYRQNKY